MNIDFTSLDKDVDPIVTISVRVRRSNETTTFEFSEDEFNFFLLKLQDFRSFMKRK